MMISIFCNLAPQNNQFGTKKNCCYCLYCCHKIVATIIVVILKLLLRQCCNKNMSIPMQLNSFELFCSLVQHIPSILKELILVSKAFKIQSKDRKKVRKWDLLRYRYICS